MYDIVPLVDIFDSGFASLQGHIDAFIYSVSCVNTQLTVILKQHLDFLPLTPSHTVNKTNHPLLNLWSHVKNVINVAVRLLNTYDHPHPPAPSDHPHEGVS